jgi:hypothetical protein
MLLRSRRRSRIGCESKRPCVVRAQVPQLLDAAVLRKEVAAVAARNERQGGTRHAAAAAAAPRFADCEHLELLLQWVSAVAASYGQRVRDLNSSFADGRLLCLLVRGLPAAPGARCQASRGGAARVSAPLDLPARLESCWTCRCCRPGLGWPPA